MQLCKCFGDLVDWSCVVILLIGFRVRKETFNWPLMMGQVTEYARRMSIALIIGQVTEWIWSHKDACNYL